MAGGDQDWLIRQHAFEHLDRLTAQWGDPLPWNALSHGFEFRGRRVTLIGARGIWKPGAMDLPLSIATSPKDPYGDFAGDDGRLRYRYFGTSATHPDNVGLRACLTGALPLIYFRGLEKGWYSALWPMFLVEEQPADLTFIGVCDDVASLRPGTPEPAIDEARRQYVTRAALIRLHQARFRREVLTAYRDRCTICRLRHSQLLDAAHILADRHDQGDPVVSNGMAMCKIHHAAFDANILGIRPDRIVEIRPDVLIEVDGPMLRYGLQELQGQEISVPHRPEDLPDPQRLEVRYEEFRQAG